MASSARLSAHTSVGALGGTAILFSTPGVVVVGIRSLILNGLGKVRIDPPAGREAVSTFIDGRRRREGQDFFPAVVRYICLTWLSGHGQCDQVLRRANWRLTRLDRDGFEGLVSGLPLGQPSRSLAQELPLR